MIDMSTLLNRGTAPASSPRLDALLQAANELPWCHVRQRLGPETTAAELELEIEHALHANPARPITAIGRTSLSVEAWQIAGRLRTKLVIAENDVKAATAAHAALKNLVEPVEHSLWERMTS